MSDPTRTRQMHIVVPYDGPLQLPIGEPQHARSRRLQGAARAVEVTLSAISSVILGALIGLLIASAAINGTGQAPQQPHRTITERATP